MNMQKIKKMQNLVSNPGESQQITAIAGAQAELERQQREALRGALEATGYDDLAADLEALPEHDERVRQLTDALGAKLNGDHWETWCEHYAPDELEGEAAESYAGLEREAWEAQCDRWAEQYRESDVQTDGMADEELVRAHVRTTFGLDLEEFISDVVQWTPARLYEQAVTGPMQEHRDTLQELAAAADREQIGEDPPGGDE